MDLEKLKKCLNCEVEILESKYPLHEAYCTRNVKKCICGEILNIVDYDDHFFENHRIVECNHCKNLMENKLLKSHKMQCINMPKSCQFCELEVASNSLEEHEYVCGSKTEQCSACMKYVQIKDYNNHCQFECDPGIKLNNHFNVDKLPFINKKKGSKISSAFALINNNQMKKVKIDSPFTDGFNLESINEHPVTYNNSLNLNQINKNKNQKNGSPNKKERTVNLNLIEEEKKENKIDGKNTKKFSIKKDNNNEGKKKEKTNIVIDNTHEIVIDERKKEKSNKLIENIPENIIEEEKKESINISISSKFESKDIIIKKLPYKKKIIEDFKQENKFVEKDLEDKIKKKKNKKKNELKIGEYDNLAFDNFDKKEKKNRKISDKDKFSKKKLSHNDLKDLDFGEVLNQVEKDYYVNPKSQEDEILMRVLEKSKKEK